MITLHSTDDLNRCIKRLHKELKPLLPELTHSQTQEIFAKTLGQRNLYHLQQLLSTAKLTSSASAKLPQNPSTLAHYSSPMLLKLIHVMAGSNQDIWFLRSFNFLVALVQLSYAKHQCFDLSFVQSHLALSPLLAFLHQSHQTIDCTSIQHQLIAIPGFDWQQHVIDTQTPSKTTQEQFSYLIVLLSPLLQQLASLNKPVQDFIFQCSQEDLNAQLQSIKPRALASVLLMQWTALAQHAKQPFNIHTLIAQTFYLPKLKQQYKALHALTDPLFMSHVFDQLLHLNLIKKA